jgi:uncharacterized membrane protein YccC
MKILKKARISAAKLESSIPLAKMAFKTAVAAAIAFFLSRIFHWEYPFYAVIAAIIVMGSTPGNTFNSIVQRLIGTIIGTLFGVTFAIAFGSNPWSLAGSVFLTIFLSSCWQLKEAVKLAGYVSAIIILNHPQSPWLYALARFFETLLGVIVAMLVNRWLFPSHAIEELRCCLSQTLIELEQFYRLVVDGYFSGNYDRSIADAHKNKIIASLQKSRELWREVKQGQGEALREILVDEAWEFLVRRIWEHILTMEHTLLARRQGIFWQDLSFYIDRLSQETSKVFLELAKAIKFCTLNIVLPELDDAIVEATQQFEQFSTTTRQNNSIDELLRFFTFFYTLEEIGRKLQRMANSL